VDQFAENGQEKMEKKCKRGTEIGEIKLSLGDVYKMVFLEKSENKLLNFR
jgi:hypothetical protein